MPDRRNESSAATALAALRRQASRPGLAIDGGAAFTPVRDNVILALLDAVDAAEDYIFGAHRAGDIAPYRRVQAAFKSIGLRSEPDA